jgi:hypothetical protein
LVPEKLLEGAHRRYKMAAETRSDRVMIRLVDVMEIGMAKPRLKPSGKWEIGLQ